MVDTEDPKTFEEIVEWAYGTLPQKIREPPDFPGIQVVDEPPTDVLQDISSREKWTRGTELLGLQQGRIDWLNPAIPCKSRSTWLLRAKITARSKASQLRGHRLRLTASDATSEVTPKRPNDHPTLLSCSSLSYGEKPCRIQDKGKLGRNVNEGSE
jgi:hypothetical protein